MRWNRIMIWSLLLGVLFAFQPDEPNRINWNKYRPLTWLDYQGNPNFYDSFRDAVTASAMIFKTKCDDSTGKLIVVMNAQFIKDQSWVKPVARTNYHLAHEQTHFDIAELYVRKFKQAIVHRTLTCNDYPEIQALSNSFMDKAHQYQMKYDRETNFSLNKDAQQQWNKSIKYQLEELEEFH